MSKAIFSHTEEELISRCKHSSTYVYLYDCYASSAYDCAGSRRDGLLTDLVKMEPTLPMDTASVTVFNASNSKEDDFAPLVGKAISLAANIKVEPEEITLDVQSATKNEETCDNLPQEVIVSSAQCSYMAECLSEAALQTTLLSNQCPHCKIVVNSLSHMKEHINDDHFFEGVKKCRVSDCDSKVESDRDEFAHMMTHHLDDVEYHCPMCSFVTTSEKTAKTHLASFHPYACYMCNIELDTDVEWTAHVRDSHTSGGIISCVFCDFTQKSKKWRSMLYHVKRHYGLIGTVCKLCTPRELFETNIVLQKHIEDNHQGKNAYKNLQCPQCNSFKTYSAIMLAGHWRDGCANMQCEECSYIAPNRYLLQRHLHIRHGQHAPNYSGLGCRHCKDFVATETDMDGDSSRARKRHRAIKAYSRKKQHIVVVAQANAHEAVRSKVKNAISGCQFPDCEFSDNEPTKLKRHVQKAHKPASESSDDGPFGLGFHLTKVCALCGKLVRGPDLLKSHKISKHGFKSPHNCHICHRGFTRRPYLLGHLATVHKIIPNEDCAVQSSQHQETVEGDTESPDRMYKCEKCHFSTQFPGNLRKHKRTHIHKERVDQIKRPAHARQRKLLSCPLCDYVSPPSAVSRVLLRHVYFHHQSKGETIPKGYESEEFKCQLCDYVAMESSRITRHMKTHARYDEPLPEGYVAIEIEGGN